MFPYFGYSSHDNDPFDRILYNLLHHDRTWQGDLARSAYGYGNRADARTNKRATKKYADGRQKGRKK